jgi:hypothetical protein
MPTCEVCENEYDKAFEVVVGGERHTFDSFERAIHALAPVCPHCNCRIVGHGVEADGKIFCCVPLRTRVRHNAVEGPRLRVGGVTPCAPPFTRTLIRLDVPTCAKYRC